MNQILNVKEIKKPKHTEKKNKKPRYRFADDGYGTLSAEIKKIVNFFAISLIVFGMFTIGSASYALITSEQDTEVIDTRPVIVAEYNETGDKVLITVQSNNIINELIYSWDDGKETRVSGNGRTSFQETIQIPTGQNNLLVRAVDSTGQSQIIQKTFERVSNIEIIIEEESPNVKVTLRGTNENEIKYMTYRWNDESKQQVEINAIEDIQTIRALPGENVLTIEAIDIYDETNEEKMTIKGEEIPTEEPTGEEPTEGGNAPQVGLERGEETAFVIVASDEKGLASMTVIVNDEPQAEIQIDGRNEVSVPYPYEINNGDKLEIVVYNVDGETGSFAGMFQS